MASLPADRPADQPADRAGDLQLLEVLREALSTQPPASVVAAAKAAFTWRTIDEELAAIAYDSAAEPALVGVRSVTSDTRLLTFTAGDIELEVEVGSAALLGQFVPIGRVTVEVCTPGGVFDVVRSDDLGCFSVAPLPEGSLRLRCTAATGARLVTPWLHR